MNKLFIVVAFIFMIYIFVIYPCCYLENFSIGSPGRGGALNPVAISSLDSMQYRTMILNDSSPSEDCVGCAASMGLTLATTAGPDEVPILGQLLVAGEIAADAYTCGKCGFDIGDISDCMIERQDDGQELEARLCSCTQGKICPPGTYYQGIFNPSSDVNSDTPPAPPSPSAEDVEAAEAALALATANRNSGEMINFRFDTPPTPPTIITEVQEDSPGIEIDNQNNISPPPSVTSTKSLDNRNTGLTNRCTPNDNRKCPFICPEARDKCCGGSHAETTNSCNLCVIQNCRNNPEWFTTITEVPEDMNNSCEAISSYDQGKHFCPYNCPQAGINCCSPKQNGIEDGDCNTCLKEHGCNI